MKNRKRSCILITLDPIHNAAHRIYSSADRSSSIEIICVECTEFFLESSRIFMIICDQNYVTPFMWNVNFPIKLGIKYGIML